MLFNSITLYPLFDFDNKFYGYLETSNVAYEELNDNIICQKQCTFEGFPAQIYYNDSTFHENGKVKVVFKHSNGFATRFLKFNFNSLHNILNFEDREFDEIKALNESYDDPFKSYKKPLNNSFDNYKDPAENNPDDDEDDYDSEYDDDECDCDCEDCLQCKLQDLKEQTLCGDPFAFEPYATYPVFNNDGFVCGDIQMPKKIVYSVSPSSIIRYENCMFDIFPCQFFIDEYQFTGKVKIILKHEWGFKTFNYNFKLNSDGKPMQYEEEDDYDYINETKGLCPPFNLKPNFDEYYAEDEDEEDEEDEEDDEQCDCEDCLQCKLQDLKEEEEEEEEEFEISVGPSLRALGYKNSSLKKLGPDVYQLTIESKAKPKKNQVISNYWLRSKSASPNKGKKINISKQTNKPKKNPIVSNYNLRPRNNNINYNVNITKIV